MPLNLKLPIPPLSHAPLLPSPSFSLPFPSPSSITHFDQLVIFLVALSSNGLDEQLHRFNPALEPGDSFGPRVFTYMNSSILNLMLKNLADTNFLGLTVSPTTTALIVLGIYTSLPHTASQLSHTHSSLLLSRGKKRSYTYMTGSAQSAKFKV